MIPLHYVVIDNLHLFLRVSDVLIDTRIVDLLRQDALGKSKQVIRVQKLVGLRFLIS